MSARAGLGWAGIARLGLVQACLGGLVVLATTTMNRVMTVELSWPAVVPGVLVALHYAVQALRPLLGHGSDTGGRRTPWIIGGVALLGLGVVGAAGAISVMAGDRVLGLLLAVVAYGAIGVGVGAAGTGVLVLLAERAAASRRAAAASMVWIMMIVGIAVTATGAGRALEPFSAARLLTVATALAAGAMVVTVLAVAGLEGAARAAAPARPAARHGFIAALKEIWGEPTARRFAVFVFLAMLAYSALELVLEPFAGSVAALSPGASAGLTGLQHAGVLVGMVASAVLAGRIGGARAWTIGGCAASAAMLMVLACVPALGLLAMLRPVVFCLGVANGTFAVSAIGAMMGVAARGADGRAGIRMGLFGAAQAWAFGAGGLLATGAADAARAVLGSPTQAYAVVFVAEAAVFAAAAVMAGRVFPAPAARVVSTRWQGETA